MDHHYTPATFPYVRMRRNRQSDTIRSLVREHHVHIDDLIYPVFVREGNNEKEAIVSMPDIFRYSIDRLIEHLKEISSLGIKTIALFPCIDASHKNNAGTEAYNENNLICRAVTAIKDNLPELTLICDVALDPYTTHGQDGILNGNIVDNDQTIEALCKQAICQTKAGCDIIAPSDMMDGRIGAIREALDNEALSDTLILSYAAKFASAFYGPFRDAVGSKQSVPIDKRTYQMDPANSREAIREIELDINEGADIVMVKPGMPYLDIIRNISGSFNIPVFAYQVSGEYSMLKMAANQGILNYEASILESILCFKRAGTNAILTYAAPDIAKLLHK